MESTRRRREPNTLYEGDIIYLAIDGEGNVHSDGFVDERLGCTDKLSHLDGCLFRILPKLSYEAHKALLSVQHQYTDANEKYMLMVQQANIEADINESLCRRVEEDGQIVLYGQSIQLQHVSSGKFLTSCVKSLADIDKTCMKISLRSEGSSKCWFTFLPRYKTRSTGSAVVFNDAVCVSRAKQTKHFMHLSQRIFPRDLLMRKEINMNSKETIAKIVRYAESTPDATKTLVAGKLYRLYHLEGEGYITMSTNPYAGSKPPYLRQIRQDLPFNAPENLTLKSLFVLEKMDRGRGGRVTDFDVQYRLRHLATGRYLALSNHDENDNSNLNLCGTEDSEGEESKFFLTPSSNGNGAANSSQIAYRIEGKRNGATYRLHNPNKLKVKTCVNQKGSLQLMASTQHFDQDCFRFVSVNEPERHESCFLLSTIQHLRRYQYDLATAVSTNQRVSHESMHSILKSLILLIEFLQTRIERGEGNAETTSIDPVAFVGTPIFHRQEKAREIKLIDVLYEMLRAIRHNRLTLSQIASDQKYRVLHRIHCLINKTLVCIMNENIASKNYIANRSTKQYYMDQLNPSKYCLASYMDETLDNFGSETGCKSVYRSLFLNNRELLVEKVDIALIKSSCRNIEAKGVKSSGILQFLSTICSYNGQNISRNQELIVRALYSLNGDEDMLETRHKILIEACECPNPVRSVPSMIKDFVLAAPSGVGSFSHVGHPIGHSMLNKGLVNVAISWKSCANWFMGAPGLYYEADELQLSAIVDAVVSEDLIQYDQHVTKKPLPREWVLLEHVTWTLEPQEMFPLVFNNKPWNDQYQTIIRDPEKLEIFERLKTLANYYQLQLGLFVEILRGGCVSAIEVLSKQFSYNMLISAVSNSLLPYTIRNSFTAILHLCWLNRFPHEPMLLPKTVYAFDDVSAVEKQAHPLLAHFHLKAGHPALTSDDSFVSYPFADKFAFIQGVIHEIIMNFATDKTPLMVVDSNLFLSSLLEIVEWLVRCGFYADFDSLNRLCHPLIRILDGRNTVLSADPTVASQQDFTARYRCNLLNNSITKCKMQICKILSHVTIIWRDFELWSVISNFKFSNSITDPLVSDTGVLSKTGVAHFSGLFLKSVLDMRSVTKSPLETICMDLMMYDDDRLVEEALSLMIQLNTRREQVISHLTKSILIQNTVPDPSIAATTKSSTQVLKELEYLVPLFKHYTQAFESPLLCENLCDANQIRLEYFGVGRLLSDILKKFQECCGDRLDMNEVEIPNAEKQSILLELKLHEQVMKLIRMNVMEVEYTPQLKQVKEECCAFFKSIMAKNPQGQTAMFEYLPELIERFDEIDSVGDVLIAIFVENRSLCLCVPEEAIWAFMKLLNTHITSLRDGRSASVHAISTILEFFKRYMIPDEAPVKANQVHLFSIMTNPRFSSILVPFAQDITPEMEVGSSQLIATCGYQALLNAVDTCQSNMLLTYFEKLLDSFSVMCYGKNFKLEVECQQIYPLNLILTMLLDSKMPYSLRLVACRYLSEVFFDTDLQVDERLTVMPAVWDVLLHCSKELAEFNARTYISTSTALVDQHGGVVYESSYLVLQDYIFHGVLTIVTAFFRCVYNPNAADLEEHASHIYEALRSDIKSLKKRAKLDARQKEICDYCALALGIETELPEKDINPPVNNNQTIIKRSSKSKEKIGSLVRRGTLSKEFPKDKKFDCFKYAVISNEEIRQSVMTEFRNMVDTLEEIESLTNKIPGIEMDQFDCRANTITPTLFCSRIIKFIEQNPTAKCAVYAMEALQQVISTKYLSEETKKRLQTVEIEEGKERYQESQAFMASCGAAKLVLQLIAGGYKSNLVMKAIEFGVEMLHGGNLNVQTMFYNSMKDGDERLFVQFDQILQKSIQQVKETRRSFKFITKARQLRGINASPSTTKHDELSKVEGTCISGDVLVKFLSLLIKGHYLNMQLVMLDQSYVGHANSINILETVTAYLAILVKDEIQLQTMTANDCASLNQCWEFLVETMQGPCSPNQEFLMGSIMVETFRKTIKANINFKSNGEYEDIETNIPSGELIKSLKANSVKAMVSLLEGRTNDQVQMRLRSTLELKAIKIRLLEIYDQFQAERELHLDDVTWDERFLEEGVSLFTLATSVFAQNGTTSIEGEETFAPKIKNSDGSAIKMPKRGDYASEVAYRTARQHWKRDATYAKVYEFFSSMHCSIEIWWGVGEPRLDKVYFPIASHCKMLQYLGPKKTRLLNELDYKSSERLKQFVQASSSFNEEMQHIENLSNFFLYNIIRPYIPHFKSISFLLAIFMNLIMLVSIQHKEESLEFFYKPSSLQSPMTFFGLLQIFLSTCVLIFMVVISGPLIFRVRLNAMIKNSMDKYKRKKNYNKQEIDIKNSIQTIDIKNAIQTIDIKFQFQNIFQHFRQSLKWFNKTAIIIARDSVHFFQSYLPLIKMICLIYMLQFTLLTAFPHIPPWVPLVVLFLPFVRNTRQYLDKSSSWIGLVFTFLYDVLFDKITAFYIVYLATAFCATIYHPIFYVYHLLDLVVMSPSLQNVVRAVTKPGRALILTCLLGLFVIYFYTMILFFFIPNDSLDDVEHIEYCYTLMDCFLTVVHRGLLSGGGVGDFLSTTLNHPPNLNVRQAYWWRILFDLSFFVLVIVLLLNIIFGITIDTFGDLRMETNEREDLMKNQCFICGLSRDIFDNHYMQHGISNGFLKHISQDHKMWNYLYFIVHLESRDLIDCTGPEAYVKGLLAKDDISWFPQSMAKCLSKSNQNSTEKDLFEMKGQLKSLISQMEQVTSLALD